MFPEETIPHQIRGYRVVRRLESRRGGRVFVAREEGPHGFARDVVLKLVADTTEGEHERRDELAREALISEKLNDPTIVRMHDFFTHGPWLVLVLEYVEGTSLSRVLEHLRERQQQLPEEAAFYVASTVMAALAKAHARTDEAGVQTPVIHRDVNPSNVLIARDATVKLSGFGLGKILNRTPDTAVGVVKGTPGYMSPEQSRGERVTEKSDVYGAALLTRELLTGKPDGDLGKASSRIPRELLVAIEAALEPDPARREITCAQLAEGIEKIADVDRGRRALRACVDAITPSAAPQVDSLPELAAADVKSDEYPAASPSTRPSMPRPPTPRSTTPGQMMPMARARTLVGIGRDRLPPPAVDDTQRRVGEAASLHVVETQRRVADRRLEETLPDPSAQAAEPNATTTTTTTNGSHAEPPPPPPPPTQAPPEITAASHPPTAPPKPRGTPMPSADAPKVVVEAGVIPPDPENFKVTKLSMRAISEQELAAARAEQAPDTQARERRKRGLGVVIAVVAAAVLVGLVALIVKLVRGRGAPSDDRTASITSSTRTTDEPTTNGSSTTAPTITSTSASASSKTKSPVTTVPKGFGRLTVKASGPGSIFIGDKSYGEVGDVVVVPCGYRWILVGKADGKGHLEKRLSKPQSVFVKCGSAGDTTVTIALR